MMYSIYTDPLTSTVYPVGEIRAMIDSLDIAMNKVRMRYAIRTPWKIPIFDTPIEVEDA